MDLLLDMGQMRMKPWKPNNELLGKNKFFYHLIFSVQFLPPSQALAQFQEFIHAYMRPVRPPEGRFIHQNVMYFHHSYGTRRMNLIQSTLYL